MPKRGTLPIRATEDHNLQNILVVCCVAAIGLAVSLGLALALQPSPDVITLLAQFGG